MNLRTKLLVVFTALAVVPLFAISFNNYRSGMQTVEVLLRDETEGRVARTALKVEQTLTLLESRLLNRASNQLVRDYARTLGSGGGADTQVTVASPPVQAPEEVRSHFSAFVRNNRRFIESLVFLDASGNPRFRLEPPREDGDEVLSQTGAIAASLVRYDQRVWSATGDRALRSLARSSQGAAVLITVPVRASESGATVDGAVAIEIDLRDVIAGADENHPSSAAGQSAGERVQSEARHQTIALDEDSGTIVYHTNSGTVHQTVAEALPNFQEVADEIVSTESGFGSFRARDGDLWITSYRQIEGLPLSVAAAENYTLAAAGVRRSGLWGVAFAVLAGMVALVLLLLIVRRATRGIESVARGASAIAAGDLGQRIDVSTSDETRLLAESFNLMSDRLTEMIAREAESKQFESFLRLSATLTHDLKNAITGLSMLVSNMERQFHVEEFRADAISSLREATEKLKRLVSRLSEPVKSLSGEYRRDMMPTDLVPLMRRVLATNVEPFDALYQIEARMPDSLEVLVEPERIESVMENLVINGIEAMGARGGRLTVECGSDSEGNAFFSVADTGVGMSDEFINNRLFRPFTTTKHKGIGLGLYTCREIVESHGGRIEVASQLGAGTRFRVVLPSRLFTSSEAQRPQKGRAARVRSGGSKA